MSGPIGGALFTFVVSGATAGVPVFFFFINSRIRPAIIAPITARPPAIPPMMGPIEVFLGLVLVVPVDTAPELIVDEAPLLTVVVAVAPPEILPKALDDPAEDTLTFVAEPEVASS